MERCRRGVEPATARSCRPPQDSSRRCDAGAAVSMQGGTGVGASSGLGSCAGGGASQLADYVGTGVGALSLGAAVVTGGAGGGPLELKTSFCTREGEYRLLAACEYGRSNRATVSTGGYNSPQANTPVKVGQEVLLYWSSSLVPWKISGVVKSRLKVLVRHEKRSGLGKDRFRKLHSEVFFFFYERR